ncbi:hypothetical protein [Roseisolibacter agri]|uniref:Lipoprotein n=1 Tax=Roseisolibacter agri TaxID=2014610 RepID=A0AA37Q493_9BACT|nr:hypothetical protein [Roseisolibacter agri]GLC26285.1 hypothetical protein rosag_27980 [Roseisolibacter agri]
MSHRPLARRAPQLRRALPALVAVAALAGTGCRSAGPFKISPISDAMTPSTLLGCVAEVAAERGLPVIEQRAEADEPTLFARSTALDAPQSADPRRVDMLTVSFKKLGRGLKVLAQTFVVRGQPAASGAVASAAAPAVVRPAANVSAGPAVADDTPNDGTLWQATQPSLRVAEARDAVLARCGSLGP